MEDYRLTQSGQEVQDILNGAAMQVDLTAETERATGAEQTLQDNIDAEATRAQSAEGTLQDNIDAEETRAKAAEKQNADDIDAIEEKIPSGASSSNKLATKEYVDDAVATATATFRGTYNLVSDLHLNVTATEQQIAAALAGAISTADHNDYCFILVPTSSETPTEIKEIDRYKFNGTAWAFEYKLNNSGFTAAQWAAINSGITSGDVEKLAALPTNAQLTTLLAGLQSDIDGEEARAKAAELAIQGNIDAEETRAKAAEKQNADDIDAIESVLPETASSENKVATESEIDSLSAAIEAILLLIPSAATSLNKLADKAFVNSSISTATATFRGTYNLVDDLGLTTSATHAQIATALGGAILTANNNDYAFVQIPTSTTMPTEIAKTERYKFNGTAWEYEYDLNNSGFTADQWAAINSSITQALVTKLSDLPTNAQLTTELGTLTSGITTINQKIPSAASQANKLVDTAAMESYIVEVLNVLTISYNVTSTDGHVTFHIEQVDGKITSVTLTTSDIASADALNLKASQADLTALASRVTTAEGNITTLGGRVSTNETDIAQLQAAYEALTQSDIIIGALPASGVANKIYRVPGTSSYSDYMWNGTQFVLMATYNNAIDPRPKKASQNLVTSGGVFDNMGALDVSELNATENPHTLAKYVDLSAALAAIPTDYQKGGMSIKYVCTYDNKYIQATCMAQRFTTDVTQWQSVDNEPTAGSDNLVKSGGVAVSIINTKSQIGDFLFEDTIVAGTTYNITKDVNLKKGTKIYVTTLISEGLVVSGISLKDDTGNIISSDIKNANNLEITLARDTTKLTVYIHGNHITSGGDLSVNIRTNITHTLDTIPVVIQQISESETDVVSSKGIKSAIMLGENMHLALIDGYYIDPNGIPQEASAFGYYSVPVSSGAIIRSFISVNGNDSSCCAAFYDSDGVYIPNSVVGIHIYANTEHSFVAPENAALLKITYRVSLKLNLYTYIDYSEAINDFKNNVEETVNELLEVHEPTNLSDLSFYAHSKASSTLEEEITNTSIKITRSGTRGNDLVKVSLNGLQAGKEYRIKADVYPFVNSDSYIKVVDGNTQNALLVCTIENGKINGTFIATSTVPQIWVYLRYAEAFVYNISNISVIDASQTSETIVNTNLVKYLDGGIFLNTFASSNNIFNGIDPTTFGGEEMKVFKKGICIGDSLTKGTFNYNSAQGSSTAIIDTARNYPQFLSKMLGITIDVFAEGGITTAQWWESFGNGDYSGNDFAIINLGLNDVLKQTGGWNEDSATALGNIINKLKSDNTGIEIFVCNGFPYSAYTNAVASLAPAISDYIESLNDTNVILVDTFKYSHVGEDTAYNNYHGTALGYWKIATELKNYISWYIHSNLMEFRAVQFIGTEYSL